MKKLILTLLAGSILAFGAYADKKKETDPAKPAKTEKADKAKIDKKEKGEEVTVVGALKHHSSGAPVLLTHKKFKGGESRMYFLMGKVAKTFAKENPKSEKVEASGLAFETDPGEQRFVLIVAKIAEKK